MPASLTHTLSSAQTDAFNPQTPICLSCGAELAPTLARLASLRCHDCRDSHAPLDPDLAKGAPSPGGLKGDNTMLSATATQMDNEPEKLLTAPQLAATLGLHVKTVYDLAARKKLPSYKIGAALRFRQSEIEQWLAGQRAA